MLLQSLGLFAALASKWLSPALEAKERAVALSQCWSGSLKSIRNSELAERRGTDPADPHFWPGRYTGPMDVLSNGALYLCPPIRAGFVHIFKSAGTTVSRAFSAMCINRFGVNGSLMRVPYHGVCDCRRPVCVRDTGRFACTSSDDLHLEEYRFFTFVREPGDRTLSAIAEAHKRGHIKWESHMVLARSSPSRFVKDVLTRLNNRSLLDGHLSEQVSFLLTRDRQILPSLTHVGRVENIEEDFAAIAQELFNSSAAFTEASKLLEHAHDRDRHSAEYIASSNPVARIELDDLKPNTKALMRSTYIVDYSCLRY